MPSAMGPITSVVLSFHSLRKHDIIGPFKGVGFNSLGGELRAFQQWPIGHVEKVDSPFCGNRFSTR